MFLSSEYHHAGEFTVAEDAREVEFVPTYLDDCISAACGPCIAWKKARDERIRQEMLEKAEKLHGKRAVMKQNKAMVFEKGEKRFNDFDLKVRTGEINRCV